MLLLIVLLGVFGILLPWSKGVDFLDPVMIGAYACLGGLFAAPAAALAFSGGCPKTFGVAARMIGRAAGYGEGLVMGMIGLGIATVNVGRAGRLRLPELDSLGATGLFGLMMTLAFACGAAWITLRYSASTARRISRIVFLLLAVAFFYGSRWLPEVALEGAGVSAILTATFALLLRKSIEAS